MVYSRRHVELLDTSLVRWAPLPGLDGAPGAVEHKLLSRDPDDGASTAVLRLPPGFEHRASWAVDTDFDAFVLSGSLDVGEDRLDRYCYTFRPARYPCGPVATAGGAEVLVMTYGETRPCAPDPAQLANPRAAARLPLAEVPVRQPLTDKIGLGLVSQTLRMEDDTGERVFVTSVLDGGFSDARIEWHPCIEEIYTLEGEGSMDHPDDTMVMRPGCYCFRPPGIPHGPFHTISLPKLALIRVDRTLVNNYCSPDEARERKALYSDDRESPYATRRF